MTRLLMTVSAGLMLLAGLALIFAPAEITSAAFDFAEPGTILLAKILGALYFAFGMVNWTARANLIGGIYGRPIAIGNLIHFTVGALALVRIAFSGGLWLVITALIYTGLAIAFGVVFFTHPLKE